MQLKSHLFKNTPIVDVGIDGNSKIKSRVNEILRLGFLLNIIHSSTRSSKIIVIGNDPKPRLIKPASLVHYRLLCVFHYKTNAATAPVVNPNVPIRSFSKLVS